MGIGKKLTQEQFVDRSQQIHKNEFGEFVYNYDLSIYKGMFKKVKIKCNTCNAVFEQNPTNHIHCKEGCPDCGNTKSQKSKTYTTKEFVDKVSVLPENINCNYDKTIFVNVKQKVIITCIKEGHGDFLKVPDKHFQGEGCPICGRERTASGQRLKVENIIKNANEIHNNSYEYYFPLDYKNNQTKIQIKCNKCDFIFIKSISNHIYKKSGCPICSEISKGESAISAFLKKNRIKFQKWKKFDKCRNPKTNSMLSFDFFLPEYNICIEFDGIQHFEPIEYWGGIKALEETQFRDEIKNKYCKYNNIKLIRIKDIEDIEEILTHSLIYYQVLERHLKKNIKHYRI